MSYLRAGGLLRYVDDVSASYVYFDGDSVVDYATLNAAGFVELVLLHVDDRENRILWEYLKDRAELFMPGSDVSTFKKWADGKKPYVPDMRRVIDAVCKKHRVVLRKEPLVN